MPRSKRSDSGLAGWMVASSCVWLLIAVDAAVNAAEAPSDLRVGAAAVALEPLGGRGTHGVRGVDGAEPVDPRGALAQ